MIVGIALVVCGYLVGSVATAVVVCRLMGLPDPRTEGSGNPGATNVLRLGGKKAAVITLLGDLLKGLVPVLAARLVVDSPLVLAGTALAAFLGHLYPVFFRFQGGKGVATAFGVVLALVWPVALAMLGTWLLMAAVFRYSSLSALTAAVLGPVYSVFLAPEAVYIVAIGVIALLVLWRHRSNIRNLLAGTEDKIGEKSESAV